jgi:hypothetical protein
MGNPLDAELFLDKGRWEAIEAMEGSELFTIDVICAHILKLMLMQRRFSFKEDVGFAEYKTLYAAILEGANKPPEDETVKDEII